MKGTKFLEFEDLLGSLEKVPVDYIAEPLGYSKGNRPQQMAALSEKYMI